MRSSRPARHLQIRVRDSGPPSAAATAGPGPRSVRRLRRKAAIQASAHPTAPQAPDSLRDLRTVISGARGLHDRDDRRERSSLAQSAAHPAGAEAGTARADARPAQEEARLHPERYDYPDPPPRPRRRQRLEGPAAHLPAAAHLADDYLLDLLVAQEARQAAQEARLVAQEHLSAGLSNLLELQSRELRTANARISALEPALPPSFPPPPEPAQPPPLSGPALQSALDAKSAEADALRARLAALLQQHPERGPALVLRDLRAHTARAAPGDLGPALPPGRTPAQARSVVQLGPAPRASDLPLPRPGATGQRFYFAA
jgi:hypothetical protein